MNNGFKYLFTNLKHECDFWGMSSKWFSCFANRDVIMLSFVEKVHAEGYGFKSHFNLWSVFNWSLHKLVCTVGERRSGPTLKKMGST